MSAPNTWRTACRRGETSRIAARSASENGPCSLAHSFAAPQQPVQKRSRNTPLIKPSSLIGWRRQSQPFCRSGPRGLAFYSCVTVI
jgi:hypothetical protein